MTNFIKYFIKLLWNELNTIKKFILKLLIKLCQKKKRRSEIIFSGFYFFIKIKEKENYKNYWLYEMSQTRQPKKCGSLHIDRVD
jgi:hypothetical protein